MTLRAIVVIAVAATATLLAAPAVAQPALAQPAAVYPPTVCATLSVSTTNPLPGETIGVTGVDFVANAAVRLELHSASHYLKTVRTNARGAFSTSVTLPGGVRGRHLIVATSGVPHNSTCPGNPFAVLHIQEGATPGTTGAPAGGGHPGGTSFTGIDLLLILLAAAVLIGVGVALNRGGRRGHARGGHPLID